MLVSSSMAATDYSGLKGDFSIFYLGDKRDVALDKIKYLQENKLAITDKLLPYIQPYEMTVAMKISQENLDCVLEFHSGRIYIMRVTYEKPYPEKKFEKDLPTALQQKYDR
jgi:hypothetical protein